MKSEKDINLENESVESNDNTENAESINTAGDTAAENESADSSAEQNTGAEEDGENLRQKLDEVKDKLLRKAAEFDNFRKRTVKEKTESFSLGVCEAVEKILPVLDSLDRAISASDGSGETAALIDGIKMTRKQFADALAEIGVSEIETEGGVFDPEKHNAVMAEESDKPSGTILEEFAKGYIYQSGDITRVIRHSMVKVST